VPANLAMNGRPASSLTVSLPVATAPSLMLTLTRQARFDNQDRLFLEMYAVAAAAAIDSTRRLQDAQTIATVEERERIARDLHDELGQLLGFLTTMVQAIRELVVRGDTSRAEHELSRLETACRGLGVQVREAILGLRTHAAIGGLVGELADSASDPVRAAAAARALQAVFEVHLAKENELVVPLLLSTAGVSLARLLAGMHQILGETASSETEESEGQARGGHNCGCGETDGPGHIAGVCR
jgi:signal transduction histidine kinase